MDRRDRHDDRRTWILSGLTTNAMPIAAMNAVLLLINACGVWQYLIHSKNKGSET